MSTSSPLVFRPSMAQRSLAALLFAGSWVVGVRAMVLLIHMLPRLLAAQRMAQAAGEPTLWHWVDMVAALGACATGAALLGVALLGFLLLASTHVLVDEIGLAVELTALPGPVARKLGAGRLTWKEVASIEKRRFFFSIQGGAAEAGSAGDGRIRRRETRIRFLVVEELERLIFLIIERSPNLCFKD